MKNEEILARIDWCILDGYLGIAYDHRLPLLYYTDEGWEIEKDTYARELLKGFDKLLESGQSEFDMLYLRDRARDMVFLLLEMVEESDDPKYIPLLRAWAEVDYKKVRRRITKVIGRLTAPSLQ